MGQFADKCLLLVRTSQDGPKQAGLTYLLLDLKAPGVTARPIHQIHGDEEFAELFLDNVEIPVADRLGAEGQGWAVAQSTLSSERGLTLLELSARLRGALWRLADLVRAQGREDDSGIVRDFGRLSAKVDASCAVADQFLANRIAGIERVATRRSSSCPIRARCGSSHRSGFGWAVSTRNITARSPLAAAWRPATGWRIS